MSTFSTDVSVHNKTSQFWHWSNNIIFNLNAKAEIQTESMSAVRIIVLSFCRKQNQRRVTLSSFSHVNENMLFMTLAMLTYWLVNSKEIIRETETEDLLVSDFIVMDSE